jgi:large subunit ribosomal protein L18
MSNKDKNEARARRKKSIRKRISGTDERPRLSVYRSNKHIYAQVINDVESRSLVLVSDLSKELAEQLKAAAEASGAEASGAEAPAAEPAEGEEAASAAEGTKIRRARVVGAAVAKACLDKGITKVVFDRNGYLYHGRVRALAEAAREAGLDF